MAVVTTYQNNEAIFAFTSVTAFTLPSCRSRSSIVIKNSSGPVLTLTAFGTETIDGASTYVVPGSSTIKIVRNSTSGGWVVDDKVNLISSSPPVGIGYSTGSGGAQTQATNKQTTVVSDTVTTAITLNAENLAAATVTAFTFTNAAIAATDTVIVTHQSAGTSGAYTLNAFPGAGSAVISVRNNTAGGLAEAIVLRVTVIKSVSA
jgi:hypothetical protein